METEDLEDKEKALLSLAYQLEMSKKNLDWFDYQVRGNRWPEKTEADLLRERQEILENIKSLEKEFECLHKLLNNGDKT